MADIGVIVTDLEVQSLPGWPAGANSGWPLLNSILIRMAEAAIQNQCNLEVAQIDYVQESYDIEFPIRQDGIITHGKDILLLRNAPVRVFTKLEVVSQRDPTTGMPSTLTALPRNAYIVNMSSGIIRLLFSVPLDPSVWPYPIALDPNGMWPYAGSFPPGVGVLLATYSGGLTTVPYDLKGVALMVIARLWKKFQNSDFEASTLAMPGGGAVSYKDVDFTALERTLMRNYARGYFPSFH